MKNGLKIISLLIIFILTLYVMPVKANNRCGWEGVSDYPEYTCPDGTVYVCLNPGMSRGNHCNGTSYDGMVNPRFAAATQAIYANGGSLSGNDYVAVSEAIRVLQHMYPEYDTNGNNVSNYYYRTLDVYNNVMAGVDQSLAASVGAQTTLADTHGQTVSGACDYERIAQLVNVGLQAINTYDSASSGGSGANASTGTPMFTISKTKEAGNGGRKSVTYTALYSNIGTGATATASIKNVTGGTATITSGASLSLSGSSAEIVVAVAATGASSSTNSCPVNYTLEVEYCGASVPNTTLSVGGGGYNLSSVGSGAQGFMPFNPSESNDGCQTITIPDTIDACKEEKECSAVVKNNACAGVGDEVRTEISILEGYEADGNKCGIESSPNIVDCIVDGKDPAGNSYLAEGILSGNKYCTVSCKEDFHFLFPGNKDTNSGRYFSLSSEVEGKKTCYTSAIDRKLFDDDYKNAVNASVDAYNKWKIYEQIKNENPQPQSRTMQCDITGAEYDVWRNMQDAIVASRGESAREKTPQRPHSFGIIEWEKTVTGLAPYINDNLAASNNYGSYNINGMECSHTGGGNYKCSYKSGSGSCDGNTEPESFDKVKSALSGAQNDLNSKVRIIDDTVEKYNMCSEWTGSYNFNPEISFAYEEGYQSQLVYKSLQKTSNSTSGGGAWYCDLASLRDYDTETVDLKYETCRSTQTGTPQVERRYRCINSGGTYKCETTEEKIYKTRRMKRTWEGKSTYITPTQFFTIHPTGEFIISGDDPDQVEARGKNTTRIPNGWGIALNRNQGSYSYALKVNNAGEFYNSGSLGRIWGGSNSVLSALFDRGCVPGGALQFEKLGYQDGVFTCTYDVDKPCPECDTDVEIVCNGKDCPVICSRCLFLNGKSNFNYRSISTKNINPTDRKLGVNWRSTSINTALELKAQVTKDEIEEDDEIIYDTTETSRYEDVWIRIKLNGDIIKLVKQYNEDQKNNGGYYNNSLNCYDYENNGQTYKNIFCYSELIDQIVDNYPQNIEVEKRLRDTNERKTRSAASNYWRLWPDEIAYNLNNWKITTVRDIRGVAYNTQYTGTSRDIIGPSWK